MQGNLEEHIVDYAVSLNEQMEKLVATYSRALEGWRSERSALVARCEAYARREEYILNLERDVLEAWNALEAERASASREVAVFSHTAKQREQRLTIDLHAALREHGAMQANLDEERRRAQGALAERDELAQRFRDACEQARRLAADIAALEQEIARSSDK